MCDSVPKIGPGRIIRALLVSGAIYNQPGACSTCSRRPRQRQIRQAHCHAQVRQRGDSRSEAWGSVATSTSEPTESPPPWSARARPSGAQPLRICSNARGVEGDEVLLNERQPITQVAAVEAALGDGAERLDACLLLAEARAAASPQSKCRSRRTLTRPRACGASRLPRGAACTLASWRCRGARAASVARRAGSRARESSVAISPCCTPQTADRLRPETLTSGYVGLQRAQQQL